MIQDGLKFGSVPASDAGFRALCLLLAKHTPYSRQPLGRVTEILNCVLKRQNFCASQDSELVAAIMWKELTDEAATRSIRENRLPKPGEVSGVGPAMVLTAFLAPSIQTVRPLLADFFKRKGKGRIVLFERHYAGKAAHFEWWDKSGKKMGTDL